MEEQFASLLSLGGAVVFLVAVVLLALEYRTGWYARGSGLAREAKEQRLEEVLESSDLAVVGGYLDNIIGGFSVYDYATSERVASAVDLLLDRMSWFVSTDAETAHIAESAGSAPEPEAPVGVPVEIREALEEVRWGEVWNGLAQLRDHIRRELANLAVRGGYYSAEIGSSPGALARAAWDAGLMSDRDHGWLSLALALCDRAVHGKDVSRHDAERAVRVAAAVLAKIDPRRQPEG